MTPLYPEEEKHDLLPSDTASDSSSTRSFRTSSSSTTLTTLHIVDAEHELHMDDEKNFQLLASPSSNKYAAAHSLNRSWRKTPLTSTGLFSLLLSTIYTILRTVLPPLLPSFFFHQPPPKWSKTSYLDGLRGVAALIVFLDHLTLNWFYGLRSGYLATEADTYTFQLPIIRLIFAGRASVSIFFVISGFVLSVKPLRLIRQGKKADVLTCLESSVLRRGVRLYIPILAGTFISALLAWGKWYTPVPARNEIIPLSFPTPKEQLWNWWEEMGKFTFPFRDVDPNHPPGVAYNGHLWTIPIEFYGSFVVFGIVLASSGLSNGSVRMGGIAVLASWALMKGRWDIWCFLMGIVSAEWSLIREGLGRLPRYERGDISEEYDSSDEEREEKLVSRILSKVFTVSIWAVRPIIRCLSAFRTPLILTLLVATLYLLSYPGESASPGPYYIPLIPHIPTLYEPLALGREHFIISLASPVLLFCLIQLPSLQRPFNSSIAQYLGKVSYSLYIVHGMVLFTLGTGLQEYWTGQVGEQKWVDNGNGLLVEAVVRIEPPAGWGYEKAFLAAGGACVVVVFWASDLFWRAVDGRVVGWVRWIEGLLMRRKRR